MTALTQKAVSKKPLIKVAVGIIRNEFQQIFLTRRLEGKDFAQSWEFPGGKVETNESPEQALQRELEEEIGIMVIKAELYERFQFEYPKKVIELSFYLIEEWLNQPFGREGQDGFWIEQHALDSGQFPPANKKIIERLLSEKPN
ncbi:8-oxo-dGTP diphosphatase MutT [Testudinibacter sp. TR-2022]|uniref:8-oxo-dGTP diphosphatase MutT n=1 Tax=Testudinibacter sp. TR-2022 TaxID=2585029 RepID=UPI0011193366|nr:8-oxo-dGTP diphosphatase MutT [Testudinibacter sp. TR-2022]TNH04018.1 8-oxo-dGTP diphosphatase MutT [Pasteurellaceae bacterium Phil31]TNH08794.1 8-oxo-dGTP diphosphatase MutT [Testudinibacter sp. TR-2022]TNH11422.1 8-oxo-dGTP diphosphatase MutT [Testudinibacter sp. TR-2022]TNH11470.1 8-oxo-dGTP diphosphatase MutT [Testudinibacter sp. TR-2022]TNH17425.1 8-oxo-dGTP diphosphatase MutT [Testudinibacter sp. TR-2022]